MEFGSNTPTAATHRRRYALIVGARPNFIKAAPLLRRMEQSGRFETLLVHTGQHYDSNMSDVFFRELEIRPPDISLKMSGEYHTERLGRMFSTLQGTFAKQRFDGIIVFGDVNSTLAGALAALRGGYRLIHVEAGLRSHDRRMPEEINRVIIDHLSDHLFTTEPAADENLEREGISPGRYHRVGNLMIESLEQFLPSIDRKNTVGELGVTPGQYVVATLHRQENTDDPIILSRLLTAIAGVSKKYPVLFPLHPATRAKIATYGFNDLLKNFRVLDPLGYFEFLNLVKNSAGVVSDSGGIQEETSHLGIPCCTLRDNTERPITVELGTNRLFSISTVNATDILSHLSSARKNPGSIPLWDARVSERIIPHL